MRICTVEGCKNVVRTREWCNKHYQRWLTHGRADYERVIEKKFCTIEGCEKPHAGRGLCKNHHQTWRFHGDPNYKKPSFEQRFFDRIEYSDKCWLWKNSKDLNTYGQLSKGYNTFLAHRLSYEYFIGKIPEGLEIDHLCRVRACVNPGHLELVTKKENVLRGIGLSAQNARKTHCKNGHPLSGENLYVNPNSKGRNCRTCKLAWSKKYNKNYAHIYYLLNKKTFQKKGKEYREKNKLKISEYNKNYHRMKKLESHK